MVASRHEVAAFRRPVRRPALWHQDRAVLALLGRSRAKSHRDRFFVRPASLLGCHRQLGRRHWTGARRQYWEPPIGRLAVTCAGAGGPGCQRRMALSASEEAPRPPFSD